VVNLHDIDGQFSPTFNVCIEAGQVNESLRANWQQLVQIKQGAGFRYIRMHGLSMHDMGRYHVDAQDKERYNLPYTMRRPLN
jgi:xylan 1,4-beta-xylosidase